MNKRIKNGFGLVSVALWLTSCSTSSGIENKTGRLLCVDKEVAGESVRDCLSSLNAAPAEVSRRLALFNEGKTKDQKVQCKRRKAIGSNVVKWRCFRVNREGDEREIPHGTIELLRKENSRSR